MPRSLTYLVGPETVLAVVTAAVFWFCARHPSGTGRDVEVLEKLVMLLPFLVVPLVWATIFVPGARTWWWLGRFTVLTNVLLLVCAGRILAGFGTGAKGQDAGFLMVLIFGVALTSLGAAVGGAMVWAAQRPGFGTWFRAHWILGTLATLTAAVPIAVVLGLVVMFGVAVFAGAASARR